VITNAEDLKDTDFACWTSVKDRNVTMLQKPKYYLNKTLEFIFAIDETEHFNMTDLQNLHFGNSKKGDVTLCDVHGSKYYIKGQDYDLSKSSVVLNLMSTREHVAPLYLNLSIKTNGLIHMKWTYQNKTSPFQVPDDIVNLT